MNETMYEVTWVTNDENFSHATVDKITIIRDGVLPGCSAPSITGIDRNGRKFLGSREYYFETPQAAWDSVIDDLKQTIEKNERLIDALTLETAKVRAYLNTLI